MKIKTYQIKLELKGFSPKIWRRLLVPADIELGDFHKIIQTAMGWTNSHLHQFVKEGQFLEPPPEDDFVEVYGEIYTGYQLKDVLKSKGDTIIYEYDFGDGWKHVITLEKEISADKGETVPKCTAGKMACPPEDIGGIWGYQNFLKVLEDPNHPDYEMFMEWYGADFDPKYFDMQEINEFLREDNYGALEW